MGRLHTLAAGTALLALGVKAQFSYQGCVSLDTSTIKNTTELYPQGPVPCLSFCNGLGYSYAAITAQFCSCWGYSSPPVVNKLYPDSGHADCSFNCDDPYSNQYCGGIDLTTLGFLYSYYAGVAPAVVGNNSSSSTTAPVDISTTSSTDVIATPSTTSSGEDVSSTSTSSTDTGSVNPTEGSSTQTPQSSSSSDSGIPSQSSSPSDSGIPSQSTSAGETSPPPTSSGPSGFLPTTSSGMSEGTGSTSSSGAPGSSEVSPSQTSSPPGVIVPTSSGTGSASPSSTGVGGAPIAAIVVLSPGQAFVISIAAFLRNPGDQALSYIPSPTFLLYNATITSFFGTVPLTYPPGPLVITVTAGQPTTGSNGLGRRQAPAGTYTFAIELIIVAPGVSVPTLPSSPVPTPTLSPVPGAPGVPGGPGGPGPVLPSYTNTVYQTVTSTITRCPVCAPEVTVYAVPIGTTCVTAQVFTTPCPVTVTTTLPNGVVTPVVTTTISKIPYNPAESTVIVKTVVEKTAKYTTTLLVAVTQTVAKVQPTGNAGAVQQPAAPPAAAPPAAAPAAAAPVPGAPAPPNAAPFSGPVAPPPNGAFGTGAANNGSQNAAPTMPVTAGASMDRFVEMFVLLCGVAFGALLLL